MTETIHLASLQSKVMSVLRDVIDPELGINVVELGMVGDIEVDDGGVLVNMRLTSMSCPFWDLFVDQVKAAVGTVDGVRLFDAFRGPHWTLLTVGEATATPPLPVPTVHLPRHEAYGTGVFLVRPDGYVGWAGDTAEGLTEYAAGTGVVG